MFKPTQSCPHLKTIHSKLSSQADGRVIMLVKTRWEGKVTEWGEREGKDGYVTKSMQNHVMVCSAFLFPQDGSGAPLLWKQSSQAATAPKGFLVSSSPPWHHSLFIWFSREQNVSLPCGSAREHGQPMLYPVLQTRLGLGKGKGGKRCGDGKKKALMRWCWGQTASWNPACGSCA